MAYACSGSECVSWIHGYCIELVISLCMLSVLALRLLVVQEGWSGSGMVSANRDIEVYVPCFLS